MIQENLYSIQIKKNLHYVNRYLRFISSRVNTESNCHRHHILPKADDMFPQFKDFKQFSWNCIKLSYREHFIAHWILAKAFPGSSQQRAFYHMVNILERKKSKDYEAAKILHKESTRRVTQDPIRNAKISKALKGRPKSESHKAKLQRKRTPEEKLAISIGVRNAGFKFSKEQRAKMSKERTGKTRTKNTLQSKLNIAASKCRNILITPIGIFDSYLSASLSFNVTPRRINLIFRNLDIIPRKKVISELGLIYVKNKTYRDYGFSAVAKEPHMGLPPRSNCP